MGDGSEEHKRSFDWMENLSLERIRNQRDWFLSIETRELEVDEKEEEEDGGIELSLGLSLGGKFGVDKIKNEKNNRLIRSSSIASTFPIVRRDDVGGAMPRQQQKVLGRTASLPVVTEDELRKRKELQTLRRMAAKRRRSEKQRVSREGQGNQLPPNLAASSRGNDSRGGCSSELPQGSSSCGEASPGSQIWSNHDMAAAASSKGKEAINNEGENLSKKRGTENVEKPLLNNKETGLNSLEDMPCVFTQGDGPNGRRIEGILYRYGKGEQVRIMCVCHGRFLSPAEFVEHAGGTDLAHPLKHIVVNPSSNVF